MRLRYFKKAGSGGGGGGISDAPSDGSKYARRDAGWVVVTDGYIDGEVATYAGLPVTVGTPAIDSAYLVRTASGLWLVARKPAGVYIRTGNAGALTDWTYAGVFPDAFSDDNFEVYDGSDATKRLGFSLGGITTGTKRTVTWPNKSGVAALVPDSVSITGAATTAVEANTFYLHSGASAYTHTLTTAGLSAGNLVYVQIAQAATALITISCAAGFGGATSRVMRNGEGMTLYWSGATFEILSQVRIPFRGTMAPSGNPTINNTTNTKVPLNTVIGTDPGFGICDTVNGRIVFARVGTYRLSTYLRYVSTSLGGVPTNVSRAVQAYTFDGTEFVNQVELSLLAGSYGFIGGVTTLSVTSPGQILELLAWHNAGYPLFARGNGTTENTRVEFEEKV